MTLSAREVLSGFSCSRRNAEKRFKWIAGRTVLEELSEARLYHAKKLLSETSLQVSDVASLCGYKVTAHFRKVFHAATGVNPLAWRNKN
jgi:LacI family transcriptional regulator